MTTLFDNLLATAVLQVLLAVVLAGAVSHEELLVALETCPAEIPEA